MGRLAQTLGRTTTLFRAADAYNNTSNPLKPQDYYSILGVLPDAEDVVIAAAYRALAQRYHPDKWSVDPEISHRRMSSINEAYEALRDKQRRSEYDQTRARGTQQDFSAEEGADYSDAFADALGAAEERWLVACSIYPDLKNLRTALARISTSLAFAYVTGLLELKAFDRRHELASSLERNFLARYFGTNEKILDYAKGLVMSGQKDAAKALNQLVDVLGSDIDPSLLISKIDSDFGRQKARRQEAASNVGNDRLDQLIYAVSQLGHYREARELATLCGFQTEEIGRGLLSSSQIRVISRAGEITTLKNEPAFVHWAKINLCGSR